MNREEKIQAIISKLRETEFNIGDYWLTLMTDEELDILYKGEIK